MQYDKENMPLLIVISGAPGSGKSTLAKELTEMVQFMYIDTDSVLQNFWLSNVKNEGYDRAKVGIPMLYQLIEQILMDYRVSIVIDMAPTDDETIKRLSRISKIVHIHCTAKNVNERFYNREIGPSGEAPDWLDEHMKELEKNYPASAEPPSLGCPFIEVDTNNGYSPSIREIITNIDIDNGYKLWNKFA